MFTTAAQRAPLAAALTTGEYIGQLQRLEVFTSEFFDQQGNAKQRIKWVWKIAPASNPKQVVQDKDGNPYEFFSYSGTATGEKSTAGPWIKALLGRPVQPGEDGDALAKALVGKVGRLYIKVETVPGEMGGLDTTRNKLMDVSPYRRDSVAAPTPAPAPAPEPVAAGAEDMPF